MMHRCRCHTADPSFHPDQLSLGHVQKVHAKQEILHIAGRHCSAPGIGAFQAKSGFAGTYYELVVQLVVRTKLEYICKRIIIKPWNVKEQKYFIISNLPSVFKKLKKNMYFYSGNALSYPKLVYRHYTQK